MPVRRPRVALVSSRPEDFHSATRNHVPQRQHRASDVTQKVNPFGPCITIPERVISRFQTINLSVNRPPLSC